MNSRKTKELRTKAHNLWVTSKNPLEKRVSFKIFFKLIKNKYKTDLANGEK